MKILRSLQALNDWHESTRGSVGFVPTMGALHRGHLALVARSLQENQRTVVSIFVNPTQFGPKEDFKKYPRPVRKDVALLKKAGVDALFFPSVKTMYPPNDATRVSVSKLTETLCGSLRSRGPEHFVGVATVVAKLFNAVRPTRAYFGLKDFQQVRVLEQMNLDLLFGIKIVRCPIVREADGLALSSRNAYLSPAERRLAPEFHRALQAGVKLLRSHPRMSPRDVRRKIISCLSAIPAFHIDYIELVDPLTLQPTVSRRTPLLIAGAIKLGSTRLIDNILEK